MASGLYDSAREAFLGGDLDWDADDIKVAAIDTSDYTVDLTTDDNLDDIPGVAIVATSGNLSGKTITDGVADASDITFSAVTGDTVEALVVYQDSGVASTSKLIAYIEAGPVSPNGADINVVWDSGTSRIFKL